MGDKAQSVFTYLAWAREQDTGNLRRNHMLLIIASYSDKHGRCIPGQERLAREAGCTTRQLRTHLAWLEAHGYLARHHRHNAKGHRTSDEYQLLAEAQTSGRSTGSEADLAEAQTSGRSTGSFEPPTGSFDPRLPEVLSPPTGSPDFLLTPEVEHQTRTPEVEHQVLGGNAANGNVNGVPNEHGRSRTSTTAKDLQEKFAALTVEHEFGPAKYQNKNAYRAEWLPDFERMLFEYPVLYEDDRLASAFEQAAIQAFTEKEAGNDGLWKSLASAQAPSDFRHWLDKHPEAVPLQESQPESNGSTRGNPFSCEDQDLQPLKGETVMETMQRIGSRNSR